MPDAPLTVPIPAIGYDQLRPRLSGAGDELAQILYYQFLASASAGTLLLGSPARPENWHALCFYKRAERNRRHGQHHIHEEGGQAMQEQTTNTTQMIQVQPTETLVQAPRPAPSLKVKTNVKAGLTVGTQISFPFGYE